ncbi:DUF3703 domain-containing protein [Methylibium petroleiphilum]|uniref:Sterol desaturase-like protein n=1 Tax=Methylibium petroleiphilum (strain ATCC BAA-1232 / LMG 22953 / PM1) TaxID=420662 RepID=A2SIC1_METPP|nr:DUF3703 domain-containing protein [Methylibium petroleiphilum]ABM95310.1 sterol desaturase-like protein [Methylibium petroleiphilum PM1]
MHLATLIRYGSYPFVMVLAALVAGAVAIAMLPPWPTLPLMAATGIAAVAWLERVQPYEAAWRRDHGDLRADVFHGVANFALLAGTALALHALRDRVPVTSVWPTNWNGWLQLLLAGAIIDAGLYAMHRLSHCYAWTWRLHAIHHSAERLYWLNGERRHPLSALLMAGPGLVVSVGLGAPAYVLSAWLGLLSVQLAFQHANLDYRVGPLRRWLGVAEVHRWHHKREYEDAQVNFGEFFMVWDRLFGTFLDRPDTLRAGDVGLREEVMPTDYLGQLAWPFLAHASDGERAAAVATVFAASLSDGYAALDAGDLQAAYATFERAHVLGQTRTMRHVCTHIAFWRWARRAGDWREALGQLLRIPAALLFTWVWMPRGNTGGARVGALRSLPIPDDLRPYLEPSR